ncbi:MAG: hypothetical protein ACYTFG_06295 [Planctomycetota bacterium]|jgi:hypothetical protein
MRSRTALIALAGAVAGVFLVAALAAGWGQRRSGPPGRVHLESDADGALESVCVHYRADFHDQCAETYADFFSALPPTVDIFVVVEKASDFETLVSRLPARGFENAKPVVTGFEVTPWAKDRFGTMVDPRGGVLIAAPPRTDAMNGPRGNEHEIPRVLAERIPGVRARTTPFFFEGGDFLCDETHAFLASNFLARNPPHDENDRAGLIRKIERVLAKKAVVIGEKGSDVPDQHIGMFLTPLGDRSVAVADPDLGRTGYLGLPLPVRDRVDIETDESKHEPFRLVARTLESEGFRVVRVPMVLTKTPRVFVTYNNAILEKRDSRKRIYMPVYDLPSLDLAARQVYEKEGWYVLPVRVAKVYKYTGSLRCLVGIIKRSH